MSINNWQFKPVEIRRAIKSVQSAGLEVSHIEVRRGGQIIVNVVRQPCAAARPPQQASGDTAAAE